MMQKGKTENDTRQQAPVGPSLDQNVSPETPPEKPVDAPQSPERGTGGTKIVHAPAVDDLRGKPIMLWKFMAPGAVAGMGYVVGGAALAGIKVFTVGAIFPWVSSAAAGALVGFTIWAGYRKVRSYILSKKDPNGQQNKAEPAPSGSLVAECEGEQGGIRSLVSKVKLAELRPEEVVELLKNGSTSSLEDQLAAHLQPQVQAGATKAINEKAEIRKELRKLLSSEADGEAVLKTVFSKLRADLARETAGKDLKEVVDALIDKDRVTDGPLKRAGRLSSLRVEIQDKLNEAYTDQSFPTGLGATIDTAEEMIRLALADVYRERNTDKKPRKRGAAQPAAAQQPNALPVELEKMWWSDLCDDKEIVKRIALESAQEALKSKAIMDGLSPEVGKALQSVLGGPEKEIVQNRLIKAVWSRDKSLDAVRSELKLGLRELALESGSNIERYLALDAAQRLISANVEGMLDWKKNEDLKSCSNVMGDDLGGHPDIRAGLRHFLRNAYNRLTEAQKKLPDEEIKKILVDRAISDPPSACPHFNSKGQVDVLLLADRKQKLNSIGTEVALAAMVEALFPALLSPAQATKAVREQTDASAQQDLEAHKQEVVAAIAGLKEQESRVQRTLDSVKNESDRLKSGIGTLRVAMFLDRARAELGIPAVEAELEHWKSKREQAKVERESRQQAFDGAEREVAERAEIRAHTLAEMRDTLDRLKESAGAVKAEEAHAEQGREQAEAARKIQELEEEIRQYSESSLQYQQRDTVDLGEHSLNLQEAVSEMRLAQRSYSEVQARLDSLNEEMLQRRNRRQAELNALNAQLGLLVQSQDTAQRNLSDIRSRKKVEEQKLQRLNALGNDDMNQEQQASSAMH